MVSVPAYPSHYVVFQVKEIRGECPRAIHLDDQAARRLRKRDMWRAPHHSGQRRLKKERARVEATRCKLPGPRRAAGKTNLGPAIMRRALLLGTTVLVLALGAASARAAAPNDQAAPVALTQHAPATCTSAELVEGRSAFTYDNGDPALVAGRREVGQTFREDLMILIRNVILLGITSLVFGLGAIGAKALWIWDDTQSSSHGWPRWFDH
jgi:hypothetical protein